MKVNIEKYPVFFDKEVERTYDIEIHDYDTYSLNHTLSLVIYPALVKFKEERKRVPGVPFAFFEPNDAKDEYGNHTIEAVDIAEKRFIDVLDKMIFAMKEISENFPSEETFYENNKIDKDGLNEYHARIQEGCELFGKHFQTLWW